MSETEKPVTPAHTRCANCGAELHGPYCHACGQRVQSIIRHVPALAEDALDLAFNIDGRIMHTLPALYLRPGFLTDEYLAGRRTRYIPPFRLMFFLSVLALVLIQLAIKVDGSGVHVSMNVGSSGIHVSMKEKDAFSNAQTVAQVHSELNNQLNGLEKARKSASGSVGAGIADNGIDRAERSLRRQAEQRIAKLQNVQAPAAAATTSVTASTSLKAWRQRIAAASNIQEVQTRLSTEIKKVDAALANKTLPAATRKQLHATRNDMFQVAGERMQALHHAQNKRAHGDSELRYVHLCEACRPWLSAAIKTRLDDASARMRQNIKAMRDSNPARQRFIAGIFNVLPQTMFVLMPLFALLLKITYLFKRRLYMEHLMVAFHSHAFIFLSLVLLVLLQLLKGWLVPLAGWLSIPLNLLVAAAWIWLPVYLFLMQKRVYRQGWLMTWLKYLFVGACYLIMLGFAIAAAMLISLMD